MFPEAPPATLEKATSAGVYDYLVSGLDWLGPDRDLADKVTEAVPECPLMAQANSAYLAYAAGDAARIYGVRQFLDLGSGYPGSRSVRAAARAACPDARIVCADRDPAVAGPEAGYYRDLLAAWGDPTVMVLADVTDPGAVLGDPAVTDLLDFGEPTLVTLGLVLHNVSPEDAQEAVSAYTSVLSAGSMVAATVMRSDDPEAFSRVRDAWGCGEAYLFNFAASEVAALFDGLDALSPGVGPVSGCRPGWTRTQAAARGVHVAGGLAVKR